MSGWVIHPASHWLFQVANTLLLLSYATTSFLNLRILLAVASLLFMIWSVWVLHVSLDTLLWNLIFLVINSVRIAEMLYNQRSVSFSQEVEAIYTYLFSPGSPSTLSRLEYKELADLSFMVSLEKSETYAMEGEFCDRVGIIVEGAAVATIDNDTDVIVEFGRLEFLDSQEFVWDHHKYLVTLKATEPCTIICWEKAKLMTLFVQNPNIKSSFFSALAHDMSRNFSEVQKQYIRRSHKTTKYIQKLLKLLETHQIQTDLETDIKKYALSPSVSLRGLATPATTRQKKTHLYGIPEKGTEGKPKVTVERHF